MGKARAILGRRWLVLLVAVLLGAAAGVFSSQFGEEDAKPVWIARQVIVSNRDASGTPAFVQQDALKVTRGRVPTVAAEKLGETGDLASLIKRITATYDEDSSSIRITSTDKDPELAEQRVDAFATAFLEVINEQLQADEQRQLNELQERFDRANQSLEEFDAENGDLSRTDIVLPNTQAVNELKAQRQRLLDALVRAEGQLNDANLRLSQTAPYTSLGRENPIVETSILPKVPKSPLFRAGLVGTLGLLLGVGLVMLVERLNNRIDTRQELAEVLPVPIIAEIGHLSKKRMSFHADGRIRLDGIWAEHYRRIRSAIQFVQAQGAVALPNLGVPGTPGAATSGNGNAPAASESGRPPRVFLFTSTLPDEGKSTSVALTALALAEVGTETLVINADFRKPKVDQLLGAADKPSLEDRARLDLERPSIDEVVQQSDTPHLWLAAAGPPTFEVGGRLAAAREVAEEAAARGATVLIDSTPLRVANDPIDMFPVIDGLILVIRAGKSTVKSLADTIELLELHHAPILGAVLVGTQGTRELYTYYDSYYSTVSPLTPGPKSGRFGGDEEDADEGTEPEPTTTREPAPQPVAAATASPAPVLADPPPSAPAPSAAASTPPPPPAWDAPATTPPPPAPGRPAANGAGSSMSPPPPPGANGAPATLPPPPAVNGNGAASPPASVPPPPAPGYWNPSEV